jgi:hypothetical protein
MAEAIEGFADVKRAAELRHTPLTLNYLKQGAPGALPTSTLAAAATATAPEPAL